jgi:hypothetical protein
MRDVFDGYTTGHGTVSYATRNHNVVSGGTFSYRAQFFDYPSLIDFQGPSISAGCNGIDIQLGSFSMIKDLAGTLQNSMRQIAAGAASYAFNLALDALCPTCAANIKALQEKMEEWNQFFRDSCEAGEALAASAVSAFDLERSAAQSALKAQTFNGQEDSWASAISNLPGMSLATLVKNTTGSVDAITGNVFYNALRESKLSTASYQYANFDQVILSMVGTIIYTEAPEGTDSMGSSTSSRKGNVIGPKLYIKDFVFGDKDTEIELYQCDDSSSTLQNRECMSPTVITSTITPLSQYFSKVMRGEIDGNNKSVFAIYHTGGRGSNAFSSLQNQMITGGGLDLYGVIEGLASRYRTETQVSPYYDAIARKYAYHYAIQLLDYADRLVDTIEATANGLNIGDSKNWAEKAKQKIKSDREAVNTEYGNNNPDTLLSNLVFTASK